MMVSFNLRTIFQYVVLTLVSVGTYFYIPVNQGQGLDSAVALGYMAQELFFRYSTLIIFAITLFMKPLRSCSFVYPALFLLFSFVDAYIFNFPLEIRSQILNFGIGLLFMRCVADYFEISFIKKASFFFLVVVLANIAYCGLQLIGRDPLFAVPEVMGKMDRIVGLFKLKAHLGTFASVVAPMLMFIHPALFLLAIPLIYFSNSSAAAIALACAIGVVVFCRVGLKKFLVLASVLTLGAFLFVTKLDMPGGNFKDRPKVWFSAVSVALKSHPYIGNGLSSFKNSNFVTIQKNGEPLNWFWAHNEFVQVFFEAGLVGILLVCGYIAQIFKAFLRHKRMTNVQFLFASILAIFIVSFLHFPFHIARLAMPFMFILAIYQAQIEALDAAI